MHILFDPGTPVPLREARVGLTVETAYERGWSTLGNSDLLTAAEASAFNVLITTGQNLRHQQTLSGRKLPVLVLPTTRWPHIRRHVAEVAAAIASIQPGTFQELNW